MTRTLYKVALDQGQMLWLPWLLVTSIPGSQGSPSPGAEAAPFCRGPAPAWRLVRDPEHGLALQCHGVLYSGAQREWGRGVLSPCSSCQSVAQ